MNPTGRLPRNSTDQLLTSQLAAYADAFRHHLSERRYASRTIDVYVACLAVFALWVSRSRLDIDRIDEDAVQRFLDDHRLQCKNSSPGRRNYCNLRAALGHLLVVLRAKSVIAGHLPGTTPVDEELRRFDDHMKNVRGLAPKTRSMALHTVRLLLLDQFGDRPVVICWPCCTTPEQGSRRSSA